MGRRGPVSRAAALRRAQQAKAGRDAERVLRERQIEIALVDYFEAVASAERLRADAQRKAGQIVAAAEEAAAEPEAAAREAVRRLRELTGSHGEVAALCGITVAAVRDMLATAVAPGLPGRPDTASGGAGLGGTGHDG